MVTNSLSAGSHKRVASGCDTASEHAGAKKQMARRCKSGEGGWKWEGEGVQSASSEGCCALMLGCWGVRETGLEV
jgi:hypothetical protein